jgi:hypothetical protein
MAEKQDQFGAYDASWWDTFQLLQQLMPLVSYAQRVINEPDPYRKGIVVSDACEWLASRSQTTIDDEAVKLLGDVVKTPECERLIRWILSKVPQ